MFQNVSESSYTMSLDYHRAITRHLGCMHALVYARACDSECRRHRSDEVNYVHIMSPVNGDGDSSEVRAPDS